MSMYLFIHPYLLPFFIYQLMDQLIEIFVYIFLPTDLLRNKVQTDHSEQEHLGS